MSTGTMEIQSLATMQMAHLPRLDWRTMVTGETDQLSPEDATALDAYFQRFIQDDFSENVERKCPCCQSSFGKNGLVGYLMSGAPGHATLRWGLAHGEAFCSKCEYPFRVYHRDIGPIKFLSIGLAYHPEELQSGNEGTEYLNPTATQMQERTLAEHCAWCGAEPHKDGCFCRRCPACGEYWKEVYRADYSDGRPASKECPGCEEG